MIHYTVSFAVTAGADETAQLARVDRCLADMKTRGVLHDYRLRKNCGQPPRSKLPKFQAAIVFRDADEFRRSFTDVEAIGVHAGLHGAMIEHVEDFSAETFEDV